VFGGFDKAKFEQHPIPQAPLTTKGLPLSIPPCNVGLPREPLQMYSERESASFKWRTIRLFARARTIVWPGDTRPPEVPIIFVT
jgi:hypothetical protein